MPNPDKSGEHGHHAAIPYADVPAFMAKLKDAEGIAVNALMLTILTAARTSEVINMTWDEVDLTPTNGAGPTWTVPGERMVVPLSDAAVAILHK